MAVIGYLRVSTGEQSIGAQRHSIEQTHKVETWFADEGVSGAVEALQRPEFAELFKFIRKGDTLIVPAVDRLGRNTIDVLDTVEALQGKGVSIISLREGSTCPRPSAKPCSPCWRLLQSWSARTSKPVRWPGSPRRRQRARRLGVKRRLTMPPSLSGVKRTQRALK